MMNIITYAFGTSFLVSIFAVFCVEVIKKIHKEFSNMFWKKETKEFKKWIVANKTRLKKQFNEENK